MNTSASQPRRVLDVGSGRGSKAAEYSAFRGWRAVRLDIDERVRPDLVGSATDLRHLVPSASFHAVWSSHNMEHLADHEVLPTMREFCRVLTPDGFALITCPDLESIAQFVLVAGPDEVAYTSPAGPISAIDMIYGHRRSIEEGSPFMAHRTGFTTRRMSGLLVQAGFAEVWTAKGQHYDLWAVALMAKSQRRDVLRLVSQSPVHYVPL